MKSFFFPAREYSLVDTRVPELIYGPVLSTEYEVFPRVSLISLIRRDCVSAAIMELFASIKCVVVKFFFFRVFGVKYFGL